MGTITLTDQHDFEFNARNIDLYDTSLVLYKCSNGIISGLNFEASELFNVLVLNQCSNIEIRHNTISYDGERKSTGHGIGVYVKYSDNIVIHDCTIGGTNGAGILFEDVVYSIINKCRIGDSGSHGIYFSGSQYNFISQCVISENTKNGIQFNKGAEDSWLDVSHNIISDNVIKVNGMYGVALLRYAHHNIVNSNIIIDNLRGNVQLSENDPHFEEEEWSHDNKIFCKITE